MSYNEHAKIYKKAFEVVGINSSKITYINRKSAINMVSNSGVSGDQLRQVGRRGNDRMAGCYLTGLPEDAIKCLAGFPKVGADYFVSRTTIVPSEALQMMVYPRIEEWKQKIANEEV